MLTPNIQKLASKAEEWFPIHQRSLPWRRLYDPWHIWVSEVMLQQTRMDVVLPYHERLIRRFPSVISLAEAEENDVLALWSGLGYYKRATMLHRGARHVVEAFRGVIPSEIADLLTIPGVGRYTAGAIASIAYDRPAPIVDGNVTRLFSRIFGVEHPLGSGALSRTMWERAEAVSRNARSPRALSQALMELGAEICTPKNPSCPECPLRSLCVAYKSARTTELPTPRPRRKPRQLKIPLFIVTDLEGRVLMRRESGALMRSMYHLPHGDDSLLPGQRFDAVPETCLGSFRHTVTDRRIEFTVYEARTRVIRDQSSDWEWIAPSDLAEVPHPSYVGKALRLRRL